MLIDNEIFRDGRVIRAAQAVREHYDLTVLGVDRKHHAFDSRQQAEKLGFNAEWMPLRFSGKLPRNIFGYMARYTEAFWRLVRRCVALRPDLIHAHDNTSLPVAMVARWFTGAKVIYDAHELYRDSKGGKSFFWTSPIHRIETWSMKRCAGIIACNRYRAEIMHKEYGAPWVPTVVRNVPPFQPREENDSLRAFVARQNPAIRRICLHQGGMNPGRGLEVTVRSLKHLPEDVGMVLVGGGAKDYLDLLRRTAEELGVSGRLFLHPPVDHHELARLTCSADVGIVIYLNISRNNYYCAPNKLYEYAAAGLPFVGADLPPIRDFLEEFQAGYTFDPESETSLAEAILKIINDPAAYAKYRENCLVAGKIMCWENESRILLDLYRSILRA
jgi:glycosyltransferase involved in cell wall biosynthesis